MIVNKVNIKNKKKPVYQVEKELSINNIEVVKKEIEEIIKEEKDGFHLELKELDNFDLTGIQLLLSLKKQMGENFSYNVNLKKDLLLLIEHSGLIRYIQ